MPAGLAFDEGVHPVCSLTRDVMQARRVCLWDALISHPALWISWFWVSSPANICREPCGFCTAACPQSVSPMGGTGRAMGGRQGLLYGLCHVPPLGVQEPLKGTILALLESLTLRGLNCHPEFSGGTLARQ